MVAGETLYDLAELGPRVEGIFLSRPNRFVAVARVNGEEVRVHVADTGRLEEILTPGRRLWLVPNAPGKKTRYRLVAARMEEGWVLVNTQLHAPIAREAIRRGVLGFVPRDLRSEVRYGASRFDYEADGMPVELKGCSLVVEDRCLFPNAPTVRGRKHLEELIEVCRAGKRGHLLIMAVRPCGCFASYRRRDPAFAELFAKSLKAGVLYRGFHIAVDGTWVVYRRVLPLCPEGIQSPL